MMLDFSALWGLDDGVGPWGIGGWVKVVPWGIGHVWGLGSESGEAKEEWRDARTPPMI